MATRKNKPEPKTVVTHYEVPADVFTAVLNFLAEQPAKHTGDALYHLKTRAVAVEGEVKA